MEKILSPEILSIHDVLDDCMNQNSFVIFEQTHNQSTSGEIFEFRIKRLQQFLSLPSNEKHSNSISKNLFDYTRKKAVELFLTLTLTPSLFELLSQ